MGKGLVSLSPLGLQLEQSSLLSHTALASPTLTPLQGGPVPWAPGLGSPPQSQNCLGGGKRELKVNLGETPS